MKAQEMKDELKIPEGVQVNYKDGEYEIKGPKGAIKRNFDNPRVNVESNQHEIKLFSLGASKKEKAVISSYKAHLKNAFFGVKEGYEYKLKVCSGHFPMNVSVSGHMLIIKNFLGEKVPRQLRLKEGVSVKVDTNIVTVEGPDKELAGQVSADIEQATKRPGFDRRIFQDGIYIIEKAGKKI